VSLGKSYGRKTVVAASVSLALISVCVLGAFAYARWLHRLASALVTSAYEIRTKSDADRTIDEWKKRHGKDFWMESDHPGGEHSYDAIVENLALARLHLAQPTGITVGITMHNGQLWSVFVGEQTGWYPVAAVSITEWFDDTLPKRVVASGNRRPYVAWVKFPASIPEDQRKNAFGFNIECLLPRQVCDREDKILPAISRLTEHSRP
jgi:hypothetical protein